MPILTRKKRNFLDEEYLARALQAEGSNRPGVAQRESPGALLYQQFQELGLRRLLERAGKNPDVRWGY